MTFRRLIRSPRRTVQREVVHAHQKKQYENRGFSRMRFSCQKPESYGFFWQCNGATKNPGLLYFGFCQCKWAFWGESGWAEKFVFNLAWIKRCLYFVHHFSVYLPESEIAYIYTSFSSKSNTIINMYHYHCWSCSLFSFSTQRKFKLHCASCSLNVIESHRNPLIWKKKKSNTTAHYLHSFFQF